MSDNYLRLIPTDPIFIPTPAAQERARAFFVAAVSPADEIDMRVEDHVVFVDQGGLFDAVSCPSCGMRFDDTPTTLDWWSAAMDAAWAGRFVDLIATMPCCGVRLSLNDLLYDMPAGFARFILEARNPRVATIEGTGLATLSQLLGCELRVIWTHY